MNIISENTQELFCYHKTRCAALEEMGEEGRDLFIYLAHNILDYRSDFLKYTEEPIFTGGLLDGFSAKDQSNMCKALLMSLHQPGFCLENLVLEEFLYRLFYNDFTFALDTIKLAADEDRLEFVKPWARLLAIIENKSGLMLPIEEDWDSCFEPALFWDDDFHFFNKLYDSSCLTLKAIQTTKRDLEIFENLDIDKLVVEPKDLWKDYKFNKKDVEEIRLKLLLKEKELELTETPASKSRAKKKEKVSVNAPVSKFEKPKIKEGLVYCIKDQSGRIKIGETSRPIEKRLKALQTNNPDKLEVCFTIYVSHRSNVERQIHHELKAFRLTGEWFNCSSAEALAAFKNIENARWVHYDTEYKTTVEETNKEVEYREA